MRSHYTRPLSVLRQLANRAAAEVPEEREYIEGLFAAWAPQLEGLRPFDALSREALRWMAQSARRCRRSELLDWLDIYPDFVVWRLREEERAAARL